MNIWTVKATLTDEPVFKVVGKNNLSLLEGELQFEGSRGKENFIKFMMWGGLAIKYKDSLTPGKVYTFTGPLQEDRWVSPKGYTVSKIRFVIKDVIEPEETLDTESVTAESVEKKTPEAETTDDGTEIITW